jgi:hypothetical protein
MLLRGRRNIVPFVPVPEPEPVLALELTFDDIANATFVADNESVSDWNSLFNLPTNGNPFTSVEVVGHVVRLIGGSNIHAKDNLFYRTAYDEYSELYVVDSHIVLVEDNIGCIISAGQSSFAYVGATNFILPELVTAGQTCFTYCSAVTHWYFPKLESVGHLCFYYWMGNQTSSALEFDFPELLTAGEGSFMWNHLVTDFKLPKLTSISGYYAFYGSFLGCSSVSKFDFPLLTTIGNRAFSNCLATEFNLPSLTSTYNRTFSACSNVAKIYMPSITDLGGGVGYNEVFLGITGKSIILTIPTALMTCNEGDPDGDIQYLQANNTVTIVEV